MKKLCYTLLLSTAIFTSSCSKSEEPDSSNNLPPAPKAEKKAESLGFSLSVALQDPELSQEERLMSYDLEGDKKLIKINLLHIKGEKAETLETNHKVRTEDLYKVPVHLFFKTKDNPDNLVYKQVMMDIVGEKSLYLPFTEIPEVRALFTDDNADKWYVKGVIGGKENKDKSKKRVVGIQHVHDYFWDVTDRTTSYITRTSRNSKDRMPLPFPMETPWTKVQFFYKAGKDASSPDAKRPEYPDALQKLHFKPLGSIMRLKISNESSTDYTFQTFFYVPELKNEKKTMGYLNNVTRDYTEPITEESLTNIQEGVRVTDQIGGGLHYHAKTTAGSNLRLTIRPGESRYVLFWITKSQNQVEETIVEPYLSPTASDGLNKRTSIALLRNKNGTEVKVSTSKYRNGYTYFINSVLRDNQ